MAVFGNLREMPFADVAAILGHRTGILQLFGPSEKPQSYAVAVDRGKVVWVQKGLQLLDPLEARSALRELMRLQDGVFEFTPEVFPSGEAVLNWPLEQLLLTLTTLEDELEGCRSLLPDPKTRFRAAAQELWLEEPLASFWEGAKPLLQEGVCAEELASRLHLPLEEVCYYLCQLRLAGKVAPVRAYEQARKDGKEQGLFRRLLAALRGRGGER